MGKKIPNWGNDILSFEQMGALIPLWQEIKWIDDNISNGGPLHIVVEDGNYADDHIDYCLKGLEAICSNEDTPKDWVYHDEHTEKEDSKRMLEVAKALRALSPEFREMVCEGITITGKAWDKLHDQLDPTPGHYDY